MKRLFLVLLAVLLLAGCLSGCADDLTVNGKTYESYGFIDKDDERDPGIEYDLCIGNLVWSVILFETAIAPIYFLGFSIMEPVGVKQ